MANWVIRCSSDCLKHIYDLMKLEIVKCESIHADETIIKSLARNLQVNLLCGFIVQGNMNL
ncbi:transposase [Clostridium sp.]|uniref:IS66 family transposase n=1 Tax=Clostridium sp. TaxID=1506 RepID=UPI00283F2807|nr:transposase [Clostridium sp.]MDR3596848.1 transposase [Clostridium sp.]